MSDQTARKRYGLGGLLIAVSILASQWFATARGEPGSLPAAVILWLFYVAPFLVIGVLGVSVIAVVVLLARSFSGDAEDRHSLRAWAAVVALVAVLLYGTLWLDMRLRLARLENRVVALTSEAESYLAGRSTTLPKLQVRGCSEFHAAIDPPTLRATCTRGFAEWDEVVYDPTGNYPAPDYTPLGRWAYRWD